MTIFKTLFKCNAECVIDTVFINDKSVQFFSSNCIGGRRVKVSICCEDFFLIFKFVSGSILVTMKINALIISMFCILIIMIKSFTLKFC